MSCKMSAYVLLLCGAGLLFIVPHTSSLSDTVDDDITLKEIAEVVKDLQSELKKKDAIIEHILEDLKTKDARIEKLQSTQAHTMQDLKTKDVKIGELLSTQARTMQDLKTKDVKIGELLSTQAHTLQDLKKKDVKIEMSDAHTLAEIEDLRNHIQLLETAFTAVSNDEGFPFPTRKAVDSPVAFTVALDGHFSTGGNNATVVPYDIVLLNHGEAWNTGDYTFYPPVRGLYFFSVTMTVNPHGTVEIVVNGETSIVRADQYQTVGTGMHGGAAASCLIMLETSDRVYVDVNENRDLNGRNAFTGFLYAEI